MSDDKRMGVRLLKDWVVITKHEQTACICGWCYTGPDSMQRLREHQCPLVAEPPNFDLSTLGQC